MGDGFDDLQGQIVGSLASGLGLQEYYALYTNTLCQGNFTSTAADADVDISACYTYSQQGDGGVSPPLFFFLPPFPPRLWITFF